MISKYTIMERVWLFSKFYHQRLCDCENLRKDEKGYASIVLLFNTVENIFKSILCDYDSSFFNTIKKAKAKAMINDVEYDFLNGDEFSIRKLRNLFAHANLPAICLMLNKNCSDENNFLYPLSEEDTCMELYDMFSPIIFNIILKIINTQVNENFDINIDVEIQKNNPQIKILNSKELLTYKGFPSDYLDGVEIPEEAKVRLIDNEPDINSYSNIFKNIADIENNK